MNNKQSRTPSYLIINVFCASAEYCETSLQSLQRRLHSVSDVLRFEPDLAPAQQQQQTGCGTGYKEITVHVLISPNNKTNLKSIAAQIENERVGNARCVVRIEHCLNGIIDFNKYMALEGDLQEEMNKKEVAYCQLHSCREDADLNVGFRLLMLDDYKEFTRNTIKLVVSHHNSLPLSTFQACYRHAFGPRALDFIDTDSGLGIPLEYLLASTPQICVTGSRPDEAKLITLVDDNEDDLMMMMAMKQPRANDMNQSPTTTTFDDDDDSVDDGSVAVDSCRDDIDLRSLGHEIMEILQLQPNHMLSLHNLVTEYNKKFQPRKLLFPTNYGRDTIRELVGKLKNVCLVMGEGQCRMITIQPNIQRRKFITDLNKMIEESDCSLPASNLDEFLHHACSPLKILSPLSYGGFTFAMLLDLAVLSKEFHRHLVVSDDQIHLRSKFKANSSKPECLWSFAQDVIDILRTKDDFSVPFHQFIPLYHHHTKHQCKVDMYGFGKLTELLKAISETVLIKHNDESVKYLQLAVPVIRRILRENAENFFLNSKYPACSDIEKHQLFEQFINSMPNPSLLGFSNLTDMVNTLSPCISISNGNTVIVNKDLLVSNEALKVEILKRMMVDGSVDDISQIARNSDFRPADFIARYLGIYVENTINNGYRLSSVARFARLACVVMNKAKRSISFQEFEDTYQLLFCQRLRPQHYGSMFLDRLLMVVNDLVSIKMIDHVNGFVCLRPEFHGIAASVQSLCQQENM